MLLSPNEIFTFTWRIENFSMCPMLSNHAMDSSAFVGDFLEHSKWTLRLFPRGNKESDYLSLYLARNEDLEKSFEVSYTFTIISSNPEKNIKSGVCRHEFTKVNESWGWRKTVSRDTIFKNERELLTDDFLTINCHMWKTDIDETVVEDTIDSINANFSTSKNSSNVNGCSCVTRINMESISVLWAIKKFSDSQNEESFDKTVTSVKEGGPTFDLTFYMKECQGKRKRGEKILNHCSHLDIRRNNADDLSKSVFIRCKVKTLGSPKGIQYEGEDEHHFEGHGKDQIWKFPVFIEGKKIIEDRYLFYTNDVLYLHCNFSFSVEKDVSMFKDNSSLNSNRHLSYMYLYSLAHYHQQLCKDEFSDITIRTGDRVFKVHKCVLGTRSPVFSAMFETDMQEKENGVVEITDVDANTVDRMITFMYTGILEGESHGDFASLYCAGDKYDVVPLKCRCRCALMSDLSVDSVGKVLHLADMYQDEDLLEAVRSFIHVNTKETFRSEAWKDFEINNFRLAAQTKICVLSEKFLD